MKMKTTILTGALLASLYSPILLSAPGESLVLDPVSGDYTITYADNMGNLQQAKFVPRTKIEPIVSVTLKQNDNGIITYRYNIANGGSAKQSIRCAGIYSISSLYSSQPLPPYSAGTTLVDALVVSKMWNAAIVAPARWKGDAAPDPDHVSMVRAGWSYATEEYPNEKIRIGVTPGEKQAGFGFASRDLPAIGKFKLWGYKPVGEGYVDDGPDPDSEVGKQLAILEKNNFVLRNSAVPTIAVPAPFDAAVLLDRIRTHVATWPAKELLDPAFAAQLDRYLVAAADAYRLNNAKAGKEHIKKIRELLEHEHKYLDHDDEDNDDNEERRVVTRFSIDRLAARVLDFDLRYVLKRSSKEQD